MFGSNYVSLAKASLSLLGRLPASIGRMLKSGCLKQMLKQLAGRNIKLEFKTSNWRIVSTVSYFATITNDDGEEEETQVGQRESSRTSRNVRFNSFSVSWAS